MAIQGEPDAELVDLLAEIDEIQMTSRKPIRAGALGREIYAAVDDLVASRATATRSSSSPTAWA